MAQDGEKEKMLAGRLYRADDPRLVAERNRCRELLRAFNMETDPLQRLSLLRRLIGHAGPGVTVEAPFTCDYGYNITMGPDVFVNYDAVILDCAPVTIGARAQLGPSVRLLAADHPREAGLRRQGLECASPVTIGADAWLGAGVIVCPGVTVGDETVIGAGSVVTRSIPAGVVAAGNPCRVIRKL